MRLIVLLLFCFSSFAQQTTKVDFIKADVSVSPNPETKSIEGSVEYQFKVLSTIDTIRIDAKSMRFDKLTINNKAVQFKSTSQELLLFEGFKKGKNILRFNYKATPKQTLYFTGTGDELQIWTQGQGKYTSHWVPSFDDVNEKVIFNMNVIFKNEFAVISNGFLHKTIKIDNLIKTWRYRMKKPMSSYLLMIAIGKFNTQVRYSNSKVPLLFYYPPADKNKVPFTFYKSKVIFDYLEKEIGVPYPWKIYRQIPVRDFLYAGMENTTSTLFAQDFVVDSIGFNDRNYVNVNAHELAHQWFGNLITAKSGKHHWLQEGFATYYAALAEREVFGEDYFYHQLYRTSIQIRNASKHDSVPIMDEKASSLSFYQKGAWALHVIRDAIGPTVFQEVVKAYLKKHQYKTVDTDDFLKEVKKISNFDIESFKKKWLQDFRFQTNEVNTLLRKSTFMQLLFESQQLRKKSFEENQKRYHELLSEEVFYPVKTEILYQLKEVDFEKKKQLLLIALQTNDVKVRQAVAEFTQEIPVSFKMEYQTLLDDLSYETREIAFLNLCKNFPSERANYLTKAKDWVGGNDKSLRLLYLTFATTFDGTSQTDKEKFYDELVDYTSPKYESAIRQNAIEDALTINPKDKKVLKNLVNAMTHHKWQFSKYARDKIRELATDEVYKSLFVTIEKELPQNESIQLKKLLTL
jgi:aminopeptidase N